MEFIKVTISLPKNLYAEGMNLIEKGLFSNFSDLVRSGIRSEFKELQLVLHDLDEKRIYNDENLLSGVKASRKEAAAGKGKIIQDKKQLGKYLEEL